MVVICPGLTTGALKIHINARRLVRTKFMSEILSQGLELLELVI